MNLVVNTLSKETSKFIIESYKVVNKIDRKKIHVSRYSMEAHAVHYNSKYSNFEEAASKPDGLAVTGFFIQACGDKDCPEFKKTTEGISKVQKPNTKVVVDSGKLFSVQSDNRLNQGHQIVFPVLLHL